MKHCKSSLQGLAPCFTQGSKVDSSAPEPRKEIVRVKWERRRKGLFCVGHWMLIMLSLMCEERSRSKCLTSVIIREQPGWKNRKGPLQANNRRFSLRVFIIVSISLFLAGLGLCCCSGSSLVTVCGLLTVVSSLVKSMGYKVRGLQQLKHVGS